MSIEAMKQALEWANDQGETVFFGGGIDAVNKMNEWTDALRQAIEQAEQIEPEDWRHYRHFHEQAEKQEPVAYSCENAVGYKYFRWKKPASHYKSIPLYTAPSRKPWVGLNWDDIPDVFVGDIAFMQGAKWALAKLKEKNT